MLRKQTDNAHLGWKIALRQQAISGIDRPSVLDCFAGNNTLWSHFDTRRYYGIEKVKGKGRNLYADSLRVIPSLDLSDFDVIDCDSYGSTIKHIDALYKNPTLKEGTVILFTEIEGTLSSLPKDFFDDPKLYGIYQQVPSAFAKYGFEMFLGKLYDLGVRKVNMYTVTSSFYKHYGYFKV